jgi:hypothetical protein
MNILQEKVEKMEITKLDKWMLIDRTRNYTLDQLLLDQLLLDQLLLDQLLLGKLLSP